MLLFVEVHFRRTAIKNYKALNLIELLSIRDFFFLFSSIFCVSTHSCWKTEAIEECSFAQINEIEGNISNKDINDTYINQVKESQASLDCLWMIEVKPGWQVLNSLFIQNSKIRFLLLFFGCRFGFFYYVQIVDV